MSAWRPRRTRFERWLEKLALAVEAPLQRWIAAPQLNPLYYTGTLAVLLLGIVAATGVYLFFFYSYGFQESYRSITIVEGLLTGRTVRAVHRYASGALLITSLIHAFRLYFQSRARGPRWLAWVSGVVMAVFILLAGITGSWLVMDQRAQLITDAVLNLAVAYTSFGEALGNAWIAVQTSPLGWVVVAVVFVVHFVLFLALAGFLWIHVLRLSRPRLLPAIYWMAAASGLLIVAGALLPVGLLPPLDLARLPGAVNLDPLYLFWLPASLGGQPGWVWVLVLAVVVAGLVIPWLPAGGPPAPRIQVSAERCTGCTKCAIDCPYQAIRMVERTDGRRHKYVAVARPELCVACGLCLGSCDVLALSLGEQPPEALQLLTAQRLAQARASAPERPVKVVFTCERHAAQGGRAFLDAGQVLNGQSVVVIPLPCVGTLHPNVVTKTLDLGAAEVQVVGCPPEDCAQREGNTWAHSRLTRQRLPRLKRAYLGAPIHSAWVPPQAFAEAVRGGAPPLAGDLPWALPAEPAAPAAGGPRPGGLAVFTAMQPRHYAAAFGFLAIVLGAQVFATRLPLQPYPLTGPLAEVAVSDLARRVVVPTTDDPLRLVLEMDGTAVWAQSFQPCDLAVGRVPAVFARVPVPAGPHAFALRLVTSDERYQLTLAESAAELQAGQILSVRPDDLYIDDGLRQ
ncbi:MAG: hydrogenase iron-sulfur subunit [Anaerolineales bacterium]|nr:hydrogenase iron-sulfur subunit [Anaerolineales bacterium]